jgi:hypothetical protein
MAGDDLLHERAVQHSAIAGVGRKQLVGQVLPELAPEPGAHRDAEPLPASLLATLTTTNDLLEVWR